MGKRRKTTGAVGADPKPKVTGNDLFEAEDSDADEDKHHSRYDVSHHHSFASC